MSVDDQLRQVFREETWDVETAAALRAVHARAHRARVRAGAAVAAVAGVALVAGIGVVVLGDGDPRSEQPVTPPRVTRSTVEPSPQRERTPTAIDGTWVTGTVTAAQIRLTLRAAGQGAWYRTVVHDFPPTPLTYRMTIRAGRVDVDLTGADGTVVPTDQEYLTVAGHRATLEPVAGLGVSRYRWTLAGKRLRLTFVSTSEGQDGSSPAGAFQRALYAVTDWVRDRPAG